MFKSRTCKTTYLLSFRGVELAASRCSLTRGGQRVWELDLRATAAAVQALGNIFVSYAMARTTVALGIALGMTSESKGL